MFNYIYRNKNNDIFSYFVENNILYEAPVNINSPAKAILRNVQQNISATFLGNEKPNIFFKPLNTNNHIKEFRYEENYWNEHIFFTYEKNIEYFKVLEFHEKSAIVFAIKTSDKRLFDLYISFKNDNLLNSPQKIATVFSITKDLFKSEEISFGHYALIFKTLENKSVHLNYMEINSAKITNLFKITSSDFSISEDTYLFGEKSYFLYIKNKAYSQQLCLKIFNDFNERRTEEFVIFEGKNIEKPNLFLASNVLYITFVSGKNTMVKSSTDNEHKLFTKMLPLQESVNYFEKAKLIGYSLPKDNFKVNNVYISKDYQMLVLDKYCNLKNQDISSAESIKQYEELNKALKDENKMLKRQLRIFEKE